MHDSPVFLICLRSWDGLQFYRGKCVMTGKVVNHYAGSVSIFRRTLLGYYAEGIIIIILIIIIFI